MTSDADDRLLAPYRPVRHVAQGDAPWPGMLVRQGSGESLLLVDAQEFGAEWAGWRAPPDGHLLAPLDIVRHAHGHSLALPVCAERLADFLMRRTVARVPLSVGEIVTIGVSLVRGMGELDSTSRATGEWWLTDAGRPTLVTDISEHEAPAHTAELLRALAAGSRDESVLAGAAESVSGARRSTHDLRVAEERLFSLAPPEPLATSLLAPRPARDLYAFDRGAGPLDVDEPAPSWVDAIARHVDTDLADAVSRATTGVWRRLRTKRAAPRRPWLVAGGAAAVVLIAGLMWPNSGEGPATADVPGATGRATPTPAVTPDPAVAKDGDATTSTDLAEVTNALLAARTACDDEPSCLAGVMLDPSTSFDRGPIDLDAAQRQTTLLDDFGGVAVLRVDALDHSQPSQLVVVLLDGDRWLLRDVHGAKQP